MRFVLSMTRASAVRRLDDACDLLARGVIVVASASPPPVDCEDAVPWSAPKMGRARESRCENMDAVFMLLCAGTSHER